MLDEPICVRLTLSQGSVSVVAAINLEVEFASESRINMGREAGAEKDDEPDEVNDEDEESDK